MTLLEVGESTPSVRSPGLDYHLQTPRFPILSSVFSAIPNKYETKLKTLAQIRTLPMGQGT